MTLTGEVERAYQRSAAEADVLRVDGVRGVTNAITVGAAAPIARRQRPLRPLKPA